MVPVNKLRVLSDIMHLPFPKAVRNLALSKHDTESRDTLNSGTCRASPSLMYFGFICCKEEKTALWLNMWWDALESITVTGILVEVDESAITEPVSRSDESAVKAVHGSGSASQSPGSMS